MASKTVIRPIEFSNDCLHFKCFVSCILYYVLVCYTILSLQSLNQIGDFWRVFVFQVYIKLLSGRRTDVRGVKILHSYEKMLTRKIIE